MTNATQENNNNGKTADKATQRKKIAARVKGGQIVKVNLGEIREQFGAGRIGKKVLGHMAEFLAEQNIGAFPKWVLDAESNPEPRQWQEVWVYERDGSARSVLIEAFGDPDQNDLVSALNMFLDDSPNFSDMDDAQRLAFVRAAVCD
jgi:hypothetical protein